MFNHIVDDKLRTILNDRLTDEDSICYALTQTRSAVDADASNEDVPFNVLDRRQDAIEAAEVLWNEEGQPEKTMDALHNCWTI